MNTPAGPTRGSTLSRLLGAYALGAAAALCAVAGVLTLIVLAFVSMRAYAGVGAALGVLAGIFAILGLVLMLVGRSIVSRVRMERELEEAHRAAASSREESAPFSIPDLGPYLRLLTAGAPMLAGLAAIVGPLRLLRMALRGYAAWRTYQAAGRSAAPPAPAAAAASQPVEPVSAAS